MIIQNPNDKQKQYLLRSKKTLDKLNQRISQIAKKTNRPATALQTIENASNKIQLEIQTKIQQNFIKVLNNQVLVELPQNNQRSNERKQGERALIDEYWKKKSVEDKKARKKQIKQNLFPPLKKSDKQIEQKKSKKTAIISSLNVKVYEKQKERQSMLKQKQQKLLSYLYTYMVHVMQYKVQNDSTQFLMFQKSNYGKWEQINQILKAIQQFCQQYQIKYCTLDLQKVLDLLESKQKATKKYKDSKSKVSKNKKEEDTQIQYKPHQLLSCLQNAQQISAQNCNKKGIRFYGTKGKIRAIIKIQSAMRTKLAYETCKKIKRLIKKVITLQTAFKIRLNHLKTKQNIRSKALEKYNWFLNQQNKFKSEYRVKQFTKPLKYQIHISSHSVSQWQRFSEQHFLQKHNCELNRIFKAVLDSQQEVRIIYVSPLPLPQQIINYYYKLLELGGAKDFHQKILFMSPQHSSFDRLPLTRILYYDCKILKKIRSIIKGQYAYIVPSIPSIDYVNLCNFLDVPLYGNQPQKLLFLQSKSGKAYLTQFINKYQKQGINKSLPMSNDIYSQETLFHELSQLILSFPEIRYWFLKIDNQNQSRGHSQINISHIIPKKVIKQIEKTSPQLRSNYYASVYNHVKQHLKMAQPNYMRLKVINNKAYKTPLQFIQTFYINGGTIQPGIQTSSDQNSSLFYSIEIEPDQQWKLLCKYEQVGFRNQMIGCYFNGKNQEDKNQQIEMQIQIIDKINKVVTGLINQKCFGYFVINFVKVDQRIRKILSNKNQANSESKRCLQQTYFFNGLKCHLDSFSGSNFLRQFINKNHFALYIPLISHQNIKKISVSSFFHLCRLQNMSFDIQNKIGNIFVFVDSLQSGCLGLMTFSRQQKVQVFIHAAQVLDFFCNKMMSKQDSSNQLFINIRSAINGYLNQLQRKGRISKDMRSKKIVNNQIYC